MELSTFGTHLKRHGIRRIVQLKLLYPWTKSPKRKESAMVVKQFQEKYPCASVTLFSQNNRLHWSQNVNFLLEKAKGEYENE